VLHFGFQVKYQRPCLRLAARSRRAWQDGQIIAAYDAALEVSTYYVARYVYMPAADRLRTNRTMEMLWLVLALTSAIVASEEIEVGIDGTINNAATAAAGTSTSGTSCIDVDDKCSVWSDAGECGANADFMRKACPRSCGLCNAGADGGPAFGAEYGEPQTAEGDRSEETLALIAKTDEYMKTKVFVEEEYRSVRTDCRNRDPLCSFWAVQGECEANPGYMIIQCAPACQSCEKLNIENRCPLDENGEDIFKPGDLNTMFERVTNSEDPEIAKLSPSVLSRPPDGPWVVTFDTFLSPEEWQILLKFGEVEGYKRSTDVGKAQFDGSYGNNKSDSRTSENAWCRGECYKDPVARGVMNKIAYLTGIPEKNSEHLQLLKYDVGQYYRR
jgi:prolyl 4-hydroxylase